MVIADRDEEVGRCLLRPRFTIVSPRRRDRNASLPLAAPYAAEMEALPPLAAFHHVALTVSNRDAAAAWYAKVLGFEELFREDGEARRACVMRFANGGYSVGLVEHAPGAGRFEATQTGLDHLAFNVASRDDLDRWAKKLTAEGVDHSGVTEIPPGAILNFRDNDGIALALFWDREGTPGQPKT